MFFVANGRSSRGSIGCFRCLAAALKFAAAMTDIRECKRKVFFPQARVAIRKNQRKCIKIRQRRSATEMRTTDKRH